MINQKFEDFFSSIYGDRWADLRLAMLSKSLQVARLNQFLYKNEDVLKNHENLLLEGCYSTEKIKEIGDQFYILDPASVIVARAVDAKAADSVLDMCAAPGGKTLVIAEDLLLSEPDQLSIKLQWANELSNERRGRLTRVIQQYVPHPQRDQMWVKGADAQKFGLKNVEEFDAVLLDAPCTGERHLLENKSEYLLWTESRTNHLAHRQYSLICSALLSLKSGGRLVYSTCSISPIENDDIIKKLFKKKSESFQLLDAADVVAQTSRAIGEIKFEKTEFGLQFLPDRCGYGPMYMTVLQKN